MANTTNTYNQPEHMQDAPENVLTYLTPDTIVLNLPFVLTIDKKLIVGMPYMVLEAEHTTAVRLLGASDDGHLVCLNVQELNSGKTYDLSWNMEYIGDYWLWSIADLQGLMNIGNIGDNAANALKGTV
jgi:hypothetical protein